MYRIGTFSPTIEDKMREANCIFDTGALASLWTPFYPATTFLSLMIRCRTPKDRIPGTSFAMSLDDGELEASYY